MSRRELTCACLPAGQSLPSAHVGPGLPESDDLPGCLSCGACCFSTLPEYLRVFGVDHERLGDDAERLVHFLGNRAYLRLSDGHCAALVIDPQTAQFVCSVYERRPDVCRWLERGSGQCRAERHEKRERALIAVDALLRAPAVIE